MLLSSFPLSNPTLPLCLTSHNISCYIPPSLSSHIKWYCLYTPSIYHPISHFPRLVYLPWVLGRHEGTLSSSFSLSSPFAFVPSLLNSNRCWLLVAIDIRGLIKPWRSCLIYAEGVWVVARKCSKDTSHLLRYLLSYSPGSGEDPARGSFCQLLDLAARFTFCTRLCLVINVCKCRVGGDKNKYCWGIGISQRVRLEDLCSDQWQPACSHHLRIQYVFVHTRNQATGSNEEIKVFTCTAVHLLLYIPCLLYAAGQLLNFFPILDCIFEPRMAFWVNLWHNRTLQPEESFFI